MSDNYDTFVMEAASTYDVEPALIKAMMMIESSGDSSAVSPVGASGLMQLMPATAKEMGVQNLMDPRENILGGTRYISQQLKTFNGDLSLALAAYNAGPGNVTKYKGVPPFPETQQYIKKIKGRYQKPVDDYKKILNGLKVEKGLKQSSKDHIGTEETAVSASAPISDYDQILYNIKIAKESGSISVNDSKAPLESYEELSSKYLDESPRIIPSQADIELIKHAGVGVLAFFPSVASGLGEMLRHKGRNVIATMAEGPQIGEKHALEKKLTEAKSLPEYMEIHEKAMYEKARHELMIEQVKKSPQEIRDKVTDAMSIWTDWMDPPETEGAKAYLQLMDIVLNDMLFDQPHKLDSWLSERGYPNVGWMAGIAGELTALKMVHSAGKELQVLPKKFNEFLKKIDKEVPKDQATISKGPLLDEMVNKMEKTIEAHFDDIGIPKEAIATPESLQAYVKKTSEKSTGAALRGVTKSQKQRAHKIAREKGLSEVERRDLAEQVTGQRSMMDMNRESAGKFIDALKKGEKPEKIKKVEKTKTDETAREEADTFTKDHLKKVFKIPEKDAAKIVAEVREVKTIDGKEAGVSDAIKTQEAKMRASVEEGPKKIDKVVESSVSKSAERIISDDLRIAEDMGIYADIKEMTGGGKKIGEILKELKQKAYYKEDLKDFGYTEVDIRKAIRAIKADVGDRTAVKQIETEIKREMKDVEKVSEIKPPLDVKRVDPLTGRLAGVEAEPSSAAVRMDDITMSWMASQVPIKGETGRILKHKIAAERRLKEIGKIGELIENPKGEGWILKRSKTQRDVENRAVEAERKAWEDVLKEEELDLIEEGLGKRENSSILDILADETGAIKIEPEQIKKLKDLVKRGSFSRDRVIKTLRERGASNENILAVFPDTSVRVLNKAIESKWWKPGQDPLALLKRRTLPNKMKAPAITRGEAHMIATMKGNDMPARLTAEHFSWENAIRTFEKLGSEIKETFYRSIKEGESLTYDRFTDLQKRAKKIRRSVQYLSHRRIGTHMIAKQPDGLAVLAQQGVTKIPKLKPKELKAVEDLRAIYAELFVAVNKARVAAGERPFPPIKNYATWIQDLNWLEKNEGIGLFSNWRTIESKMVEIKRVPEFKFAKFRAGPEIPRKLNLNPFETMEIYAKSASKYIEMAPRLSKLNELLTERFGMAQNAPHAYNFIRHWLNYQAGKIPAWDIAHPKTRRAMQVLNSNIVYSLLAYNVRSAIIQPAALANSYAILGEYYMGAGVAQIMSRAKWKMAGEKSNVLNTRSPETALYEAMEAGGKMPGKIQKDAAKVGLLPLAIADSVSARITWLGAHAKGLKKFKSDRQACNYADDIVVKTQASAARSDIAPIQRTQLGKTVTCLQTFVINHWGFLTKDVMGIKNADIKNPVIVKRVIRFILATTAVNALFEDGLGLNSPNPTPIRAYREEFEKTEDSKMAFVRGVKEIAEYVPLWGGRLRYGSEIGGPVLTETLKLIEEGDPEAITKLIGIPGANQFFKMVRTHERGGSDLDILLGRTVKEEPDLTAPIGKRGQDDLGAPIR